MSPIALFLLVGLALFAVYNYFFPKRKVASGKKLPPLYSPVPVVGAALEYGKDQLGTVDKCYKQFGDLFTMKVLGFHMTFCIGPEASKVFFLNNDDVLSPKEAYQFVVPVFGPGVVYDSPTTVMNEQLTFIRQALLPNNLKKAVPKIVDEVESYLSEKWGSKGSLDILDEMNNITIRTASRSLLGDEIRSKPQLQEKFAQWFHDLEGGLNVLAFFWPNAPTPAHKKRDTAREEIVKIFHDIINIRRNMPEDQRPDDMVTQLIFAKYKNDEKLTDDQICGMLIGVLFAGQHTSGITSSWTGLFLYNHPEFMEMVLKEQKELDEKYGKEITFDRIKDSVVLEAAVREALRLFPPLIFLVRKVKKEISYNGYTIPEGDLLTVSPAYSMRLPDIYPNPEEFNPNRILNKEHLSKQYSYSSFGGGRHGCPGENYGILQIKTIWTVLFRTYDIKMPPVPKPDYTNMVVGPTQPCMFDFSQKA